MANATNSSIDAALLAACQELEPAALVHLLALPLWTALLVLWSCAIWLWGRPNALELHRVLLWIPCIELTHGMLSMLHYLFCPWRSATEKAIGAAWVVVAILKEPICMACLLLVAKGWCLTNPRLSSNDILRTAASVSWLYAAVIIELSAPRHVGTIALLSATFLLAWQVLSSIVTNLRVLAAQLLAAQRLGIDPSASPAFVKFRMFYWLLGIAALFFGGRIAVSLTHVAQAAPWASTFAIQSLELMTAFGIGMIFWPRSFDVPATLAHQLHAALAHALVPQLRVATVALGPGDGNESGNECGNLEESGGGAAADRVTGTRISGGISSGGDRGGGRGGSRPPAAAAAAAAAAHAASEALAAASGVGPPPDLLLVINPAGWCDGPRSDGAGRTAAEAASAAAIMATAEQSLVIAFHAPSGSTESTRPPQRQQPREPSWTQPWQISTSERDRPNEPNAVSVETAVAETGLPMASLGEVFGGRWSGWRATWGRAGAEARRPRSRWRSAQVAPAPPSA